MFIPDNEWDALVGACLELIEAIECVPTRTVCINKESILFIIYNIVNKEDQKIPRKKRKKKVKLLS